VVNIAQRLHNHPNDYQQVQIPVNKSNHQSHQVHISPDRPRDLSVPYQHLSTAENLNRPYSDRKLHSVGTVDEAQLRCASQYNQFLENTHLPYRPDMTEQLDAEETYYEVRRRNSPPSRNVQMSADEMVVSGHEGDTVPLQNLAMQVGFGRNHVDERHACNNRH
jgi:hypothetical protein